MATKRTRKGVAKSAPPVPDDGAETESAETAERSDAELIGLARKSLMEAIPSAATALVEGAMDGSVPHIKLLLQLVGLDESGFTLKEVRPREKTLEEIVMEQWNREP